MPSCITCHPECGKCGPCGCGCPENIKRGIRPFIEPKLIEMEVTEFPIMYGSSSYMGPIGFDPMFRVSDDVQKSKIAHLEEKLKKSEDRRMEQSRQIMALMADLSSAKTEAAQLKELITQHWRDNEGHNHCWRNNFRLWEGAGLKPKELRLPPRDEAEEGCRAFWDELYSNPDRWPDFVELPTRKKDGTE